MSLRDAWAKIEKAQQAQGPAGGGHSRRLSRSLSGGGARGAAKRPPRLVQVVAARMDCGQTIPTAHGQKHQLKSRNGGYRSVASSAMYA